MNATSNFTLAFCTGDGQTDTHALTLDAGTPDERLNPHPNAGKPYGTISGTEIARLVAAPPTVPKERGQWIIGSTHAGHDARSHEAQRKHGAFWWLAADIDKGNPSLSDVKAAVTAAVGDVRRLIYSSRSATPDDRRWRVLLPLTAPVAGEDYYDTASALFYLLEAEGLVCDRALARPGQLVYLPNRGTFYEHEICRGERLALTPEHAVIRRREGERDRREQAAREAQAERDRKASERAARAAQGDTSPIDHFNANHTVEQLLGRYGYEQLGRSPHWRSPMQTSKTHATRCYGDYWVSLSSSDAAAGIGAGTSKGHRHGDAFDLFCHFEHDGNQTEAVRAYAREAGLGHEEAPDLSFLLRSRPEIEPHDASEDRPTTGEGDVEAHDEAEGDDEKPAGPELPEGFDLAHDALAIALGERSFDRDARHVASWGRWLFWTGQRWEVDDRLAHMTRTRAFLRDEAARLRALAEREAQRFEDDKGEKAGNKLRTEAEDAARNLLSKYTVSAVESLARSNPRSVASAADFDGERLLLGTPGGTVDIRTGELRSARRGDMITKLTACAPAERGTEPALWLRFLREIFDGDEELVAFMQRAAGYALTGMTTEHKLLFLYGTGRNGKSVFLNTLIWLWNDYARRAAAETFLNTVGEKHPTALAGLQGARLVAGSELPVGKTWDESIIKDLTGGDVMTARYMRGDFFDFDPHLTLMIAGNNQPSFRGVDEAIRARVVLVPFLVTIPPERRDRGLAEKLRGEGPAILRWAIDGALAWQERGLDVPARVAAASEEYMDDEDTLGQFLADVAIRDPGGFVTTSDLHEQFRFWCERQGLSPWTLRTLQKEMKSRGWVDMRRNYGRGFLGLRLGK